jgi:bidirectional [NiFe] hydrogenase diaphorase subunit
MTVAKTAPTTALDHPSGDKRFKVLEVAMKRSQFRHDALIEILHSAQELFGYLEPDLLYFIARRLKLPPSRVYGVATFYHLFTLKPNGRHVCVICTGTACYVKGADALLAAAGEAAHIGPGETTADGEVSLLTARCLGACGNAPVVVMDGAVLGRQSTQDLEKQMKGWLQGGPDGPR